MKRSMEGRTGRRADPLTGRAAGVVLLATLAAGLPGCGLIVTQAEFDKNKEQTQGQIQVIRKQLLAHTQILANHGKSINEVRLQLRDALTSAKKAGDAMSAKAAPPPKEKPPARRTAKAAKERQAGKRMYVRSSYRGLPLNYAGGYRAPRGRRLPYRLSPGTAVEVLSGDRRGFTQVRVMSGRWKGKEMWVRTRWLVEKAPARKRARERG